MYAGELGEYTGELTGLYIGELLEFHAGLEGMYLPKQNRSAKVQVFLGG